MTTTVVRGAPARPAFSYRTSLNLLGIDWDVEVCCDVTTVDAELNHSGPTALPTIDIWAIVLTTWCGERRIALPPGVRVDLEALDLGDQERLQDEVLTAYLEQGQ